MSYIVQSPARAPTPLDWGHSLCLRPDSAQGGQPPSASYVQGPARWAMAGCARTAQRLPRPHLGQAAGSRPPWSGRQGSHPPGPSPGRPHQDPGPLHRERPSELGRQKLSWTAAGSRVGTGGRGAGRAWLDPGRPPSERKACPRCPWAPPRGGAKVREAGARAAQAQTIRDSSGDGARPGRQAALVLVIGYGRAGELRQRVLDTH